MSRLIDIGKGSQVRITSIEGDPRYKLKLNQFGLFPGDLARVIRFAPFNGPVLVEVRGMEIALSKRIAEHILVEEVLCDSC